MTCKKQSGIIPVTLFALACFALGFIAGCYGGYLAAIKLSIKAMGSYL